jgi:predicted ribosomally synthesized peptide with nif11-like leader
MGGSFQEFLERVKRDPALRGEMRAKWDPAKGVPAGELAAFAASKGYTFKVDEVGQELSDDQLGSVAGGLASQFKMPVKIAF